MEITSIAPLLIVGVLLVTSFYIVRRLLKRRRQPGPPRADFKAIFVLGAVWFPVGLIFTITMRNYEIPNIISLPLLIIGGIYLVVGWMKRSKWENYN
ncbi:hypothetical protein ACFLYV_03320 [Chloroflexota bacterium]